MNNFLLKIINVIPITFLVGCSSTKEDSYPEDFNHIASFLYSYDDETHYRKCLDCDKIFDEGKHSYWFSYDENNNQTKRCDCGYQKVVTLFDQDNDFYYYKLDDGTLSIRNKNNTVSGKIIIPNSFNGITVSTIAGKGFSSLNNVEEIVLPETITRIERSSFFYSSYSSINLPSSLEYIGPNAFSFSKLDTFNVPKSVKVIEPQAFYDCFSLKAINVDEDNINLKSVDGVVYSKSGDQLLHFPTWKAQNETYSIVDGTQVIGEYAFAKTYVDSIILPNSIKTIMPYAFSESKAQNIKLNQGLKNIEEYAFNSANNLKELVFPSSLNRIDEAAFAYAGGSDFLINVDHNKNYKIKNNILYSKDCKVAITSFGNHGKELVLENETEYICSYAFVADYQVEKVSFGNKVRIIGTSAFINLYSIESIKLPNSLLSLQGYVFSSCANLKELIIPKNIVRVNASTIALNEQIDIIFEGTKAEWEKVVVELENMAMAFSKTIVCSDGEIICNYHR